MPQRGQGLSVGLAAYPADLPALQHSHGSAGGFRVCQRSFPEKGPGIMSLVRGKLRRRKVKNILF